MNPDPTQPAQEQAKTYPVKLDGVQIWREADDLVIMHLPGLGCEDIRLSEAAVVRMLDDLRRVTPTHAPSEGQAACLGGRAGHCAGCGTDKGPLVLVEDSTLCEECNLQTYGALRSKIDLLEADHSTLEAQLAAKDAALKHFMYCMGRYGNWDGGCFYYNSTSASELVTPMEEAEKALSPTSGQALIDRLAKAESKPEWSKDLPNESGYWWHWDGDEDDAPFIHSIMYSGTADKYFVSRNTMDDAPFVEDVGGYWIKAEPPEAIASAMRKDGHE